MDKVSLENVDDSTGGRDRSVKQNDVGSKTPNVNDEELESEMKQLQERITKTLSVIERASERMKSIKFERERARINHLQQDQYGTDGRENNSTGDNQSASGIDAGIDPDIIELGDAIEEMLKQIPTGNCVSGVDFNDKF